MVWLDQQSGWDGSMNMDPQAINGLVGPTIRLGWLHEYGSTGNQWFGWTNNQVGMAP